MLHAWRKNIMTRRHHEIILHDGIRYVPSVIDVAYNTKARCIFVSKTSKLFAQSLESTICQPTLKNEMYSAVCTALRDRFALDISNAAYLENDLMHIEYLNPKHLTRIQNVASNHKC